jgi:GTPase Era involved in 16S rRNA processing
MAAKIPRLAIMGHPNAGKSSVVATLTENDRIAIDKRAGTTTTSDVYPVVIDGRTVIEFIDTPGFQNPNAILEWFQANEDKPDLARAFVNSYCSDPLYSHDCALLQPVADGAGIILVVDGSKRIKEKDRVEIELLRLTARPRMAILNNLTNQNRYMDQWQDALSKAFNSVREFNAHRATYAERIKLLNALRSIDQRWEHQVEEAIDAFERDWERRSDQAVGCILELLKSALSFKVSKAVKDGKIVFQSGRDKVKAEITAEFEEGLRQLEVASQEQIRSHFRHNVWNVPPDSILGQDLLSDDVGQALGLSRRQLALVGMAAGAASGATIDLATVGHSLGGGALLGAAAGGVLGMVGGRALAKLNIERAPGTHRFTIGPVSNPRFPFVLLDRIVLYSARAMNWAHGRQAAEEDAPDRVPEKVAISRQGFTEELSAQQQRDLARFFQAARRGKESHLEAECRTIIKGILRGVSMSEIDSRSNL